MNKSKIHHKINIVAFEASLDSSLAFSNLQVHALITMWKENKCSYDELFIDIESFSNKDKKNI